MKLGRQSRPVGRNRPTSQNAPQPRASSGDYMSYHSSRLPQEERTGARNRGEKQPWYHFLKGLPSTLAIIVIVFSLGYLMVLGTDPKIVTVSTRSDVKLLRPTEDYRKAAEDILKSSPLNLTKITVDSTGFEREMRSKFPELQQVSLSLPLVGKKPIVQLQARRPALTMASQQGLFLIDSDGGAMMRANEATGIENLGLEQVVDESNLPVEPGSGALTTQEVTFINVLTAQVRAGKQNIESVQLPAIVNQINLKIKDQPYIVKFDMQNDPRTSAGAFLAVKQKLDNDKIVPSQYIDVRLEDRAFYK